MAKKQKAAGRSVMEQLQAYSPTWYDEPEKKEEKKDADSSALILERLGKLEAENAAYRQRELYQGFAAPKAPAETAPKKRAEISLEGLPDPMTHPKDYTAEYHKRAQAQFDAKLEEQRQAMEAQASQGALAQRVWEGFKAAKPEWAQHTMLAEAAAAKVSRDLTGRGVDVLKMINQQPDLFYGEVAGVLDKEYPQLKKKEGEEEEDDGEEPMRTAGVFGGTPGRQKGGSDLYQQQDTGEGSSMLADLAAMQHKAGFR